MSLESQAVIVSIAEGLYSLSDKLLRIKAASWLPRTLSHASPQHCYLDFDNLVGQLVGVSCVISCATQLLLQLRNRDGVPLVSRVADLL
jgi:hypothetical protein